MKPLTGQDAFFLYAETPEQHMHTVGTILLDPATAPRGVAVADLMDCLRRDIDNRPTWRQKLVDVPLSLTPPVLVDDPDYDFGHHVHHIALPRPGTQAQLEQAVADIASRPLDVRLPLWETWFIEGLEGGLIAWVTKTHHCLADGVSGAQMMARLYDLEPEPARKKQAATQAPPYEPQSATTLQLVGKALQVRRATRPGLTDVVGRGARSLWKRRKLLAESERAAQQVPGLMQSAPRLKINRPISQFRSVAFGSVAMDDLKAIKDHYDVSLNDVVLAAGCLALRHYLIATDDLPTEPLLCVVPVSLSLKAGADQQERANAVGNMVVKLPVQSEDSEEVIRAIHTATLESKRVFDATFEDLFGSFLSSLPPRLASGLLGLMFSRFLAQRLPLQANCIISNIPGPPMPLYMRGARLEASYGMGPITTAMGPNFTLMSYRGRMDFCVQACRKLMPDLSGIARDFEATVARLRAELPAARRGAGATPARRRKASTGQGARRANRPAKSAPARRRSSVLKARPEH